MLRCAVGNRARLLARVDGGVAVACWATAARTAARRPAVHHEMRPIGCQLGTAGLPRGMHSLVSMERAQFAGAGRLPQTSLRTQWHSARLSRPCSNETVAREASATARQAPQVRLRFTRTRHVA